MRKFLLMLLVVLAVPTLAQNSYKYRMSSFMSEDAQVVQTYGYADATGHDLRSIHEVDYLTDPVTECIDSLHYDENGNILQIATHQVLDGEWLKVCWVDYTYNEMGLRATRKNYNDFHDGWGPQLGGIYYYNYNEQGQMTDYLLEFAGIDYQKGVLSYYEETGLLQAELIQTNPFTNVFENSFLTEYYYDENEYLTEMHDFQWDLQTSSWVLQSIHLREYDEAGNCTIAMSTTPSGSPQVKYVYKYDDKVSADEIFFYPNPEDDFPILPQMKNMLTSYEFWAVDQEGSNLVYVLDYLLGYEVTGEGGDDDTTSVNEARFASRIYPNPVKNYMTIESEEADFVQVLDIYGREIYAAEVRGTLNVNMSDYANGVYFVKLHSKEATSVQRIVKN